MPYEGAGVRHTATATKACTHGQIVVEDGFVGSAFKTEQIDRFVRPRDGQRIDVGEEFEIQLGGVHEALLADGLSTADVGDLVYITPADNRLTTTNADGLLPVGVITEVVPRGEDEVGRINSNAWQAFFPQEVA